MHDRENEIYDKLAGAIPEQCLDCPSVNYGLSSTMQVGAYLDKLDIDAMTKAVNDCYEAGCSGYNIEENKCSHPKSGKFILERLLLLPFKS